MRFNDYEYARPDLAQLKPKLAALLQDLGKVQSLDDEKAISKEIMLLRAEIESMSSLCSIRHSIDTRDEFYKEEQDFFDTHYPELIEYFNQYYQTLLESPFRKELEAEMGSQIFTLAEINLRSFKPVVLEDMVQENKASTEYGKLKAQAEIWFDNQKYNLSSITPLLTNPDRQVRLQATQAKWKFFEDNAPVIEDIYDRLVKNRHQQALKLGYRNFVGLGYARMQRSDYNAEMVANFRNQIVEHIVPIASALYERQARRLGLDTLYYHDEAYEFPSGNPKPKGGVEWQTQRAAQMYAALSKETHEFFSFMTERELMDLAAKDGKETGGYCAFVYKYQSPFIFSNFNGTSGDVEVLTHEAGHAFQCYATSRNTTVYDYLWPTTEACEIHSMSMEFFTWPWMNLFFEDDTDKFKFSHLGRAIRFMPYGCAVDEFQEKVYENPNMTPAERNALWLSMERKYLPHRRYQGLDFLEKGGLWQQQSHIFQRPFYYIDYVLAQVCALQFWKRSLDDKQAAWEDYVRLCKIGGAKPFLELVQMSGLRSPFLDGCLSEVVRPVKAFLDGIDDSAF